ncbi:MAG: coproporphyrinogen III oxidase family protein [Coriobacteriales bacterium]|nr:coproporphyrinogen III oxidase family protein [Coriobacteriales bacterium]
MLSERILSTVTRALNRRYLNIRPIDASQTHLPAPQQGREYMLYAHVPFCERLCPYCSFNRFPFTEQRARSYFNSLRREMRMLKDLGYDFTSLYIGGGTPTVLIDELCATIDLARALFSLHDVSTETNPNHLTPAYLDALDGRVQRLSVGVQSFDNDLLKQMDRYDKYGSALQVLERLLAARGRVNNLNVDMIFNFPSQTEDLLINDLAFVLESGASQTTFYPLMASPVVERSLARTVGQVDYHREARFYEIISEALTGGPHPAFAHGSAWTFNALTSTLADKPKPAAGSTSPAIIDEYIIDYEEYPAIGSGGFSYLDGGLYVNTFSLGEYRQHLDASHMSVMGKTEFSTRDRMRYRLMMQLFGLRLDKQQWHSDFGVTVAQGLPAEYAFLKTIGAFATDTATEITLTPKGRYLMVALMRQFFIGVNAVRDQARAALPPDERELLFGC